MSWVPIMPQEFHVLQCYSCQTFQVHQVKKTPKWSCRMCGKKQSLKKVFGRGTGAECRQHVQRLNSMRGELVQPTLNTSYTECDRQSSEGFQMNVDDGESMDRNRPNMQNYENTKWNVFVKSDDVNDDHSDDDDDIYTTDAQQFKSGRKRKRETKRGNQSASSSTKWSEFSNTTDSESHDNGGRDSMERHGTCYSISKNNHDLKSRMKWNTFGANKSSSLESLSGGIDPESHDLGFIDSLERNGTHYPTSGTNRDVQRRDSTGYRIQEHKFQGKYLINTSGHYSNKRTKGNTFGANEPSSLESSVGLAKTQLNTFQTAPCFQKHDTLLDKRQNSSSTGTINLLKNKYRLFAESDLSSQESHEGELEEDAHDSRPYLTFDPEKMRNLGASKKLDSSAAESCNLAVDIGTICDHRDKETPMSSSSKWMSFVTNQNSQYGQNSAHEAVSIQNPVQEMQSGQTCGQNFAHEDQSIQSPVQEMQSGQTCGQNFAHEDQSIQSPVQEMQSGQTCGQNFAHEDQSIQSPVQEMQSGQTCGQNSAQEDQSIQSPVQEMQSGQTCCQNSAHEDQSIQSPEQKNQSGQHSEQKNHSGQNFINHEADLDFDDAKENSPPEKEVKTKWLSFMEGEEMNKSCHLLQNEANSGSMVSVVRIERGSCYELKCVLKNIEEMKPVFTAGDLEDSDFDL